MASLFVGLTAFITSVILRLGYIGILGLMTLEGIFTPIPSELIVPFAGYLAAQGQMDLVLVIVAATAGATIGSTVAYYIGYYFGRPVVLRYGRLFGLDEGDLRWAESWFAKYGYWGNLIGHALPGVRSFVSFPAGMGKMDVRRYILSTAVGSAIWNTVLAVVGFVFLDRWIVFAETTESVDLYIFLVAFASVLGYVYWRKRGQRDVAKA